MRREIAGSVRAAEFAQVLVARVFARTGMPPATERDLGLIGPLTPPRESMDSVHVRDGRIEIVFGESAGAGVSGRSLYLTPFETVDQRITWSCGNRRPAVGLYPLGFAGGTDRPAQFLSTVDARYLPRLCR